MSAAVENPLRAFVRGTWLLLIVQLVIAAVVFGALAVASAQLNGILSQTAQKQAELEELERRAAALEQQTAELSRTLNGARESTPLVRNAIIAFHNGQYDTAIGQYEAALRLDPENAYILDLLSYSHYMAARRTGDAETAQAHYEKAVGAITEALRIDPSSMNGYVQLAIFECAQGDSEAGFQAFQRARAVRQDADRIFSSRLAEIPSGCAPLRAQLRQESPTPLPELPDRRAP